MWGDTQGTADGNKRHFPGRNAAVPMTICPLRHSLVVSSSAQYNPPLPLMGIDQVPTSHQKTSLAWTTCEDGLAACNGCRICPSIYLPSQLLGAELCAECPQIMATNTATATKPGPFSLAMLTTTCWYNSADPAHILWLVGGQLVPKLSLSRWTMQMVDITTAMKSSGRGQLVT